MFHVTADFIDMFSNKYKENEIEIVAKGSNGKLEMRVEIDGEITRIKEKVEEQTVVKIPHFAKADTTRIRIDRISAHTPFVYQIKVK